MSESKKKEIVIVGAGIIGVCTAYYLTRHPKYSEATHHITIVEAVEPAAGASGKAGGLVALWAFPDQIVPLSFRLHQELADEYDGAKNWGYRRVKPVAVMGGDTSKYSRHADVPDDLDWIRGELVNHYSEMGTPEDTGQVHPKLFTKFILERAIEKGVELEIGQVTEIIKSNGKLEGVKIRNEQGVKSLLADQVVVAAGPWTAKLLDYPISGQLAHSITIDPGREVSPYAIFTEYKIKTDFYGTRQVNPEIYARRDEVYVCGESDSRAELPETAADVRADHRRCEDLFAYAGEISEELKKGKLLAYQACFLPVVDAPTTGPLVGETNINGLYMAAGHSCWGISNGPGTGKVMSEIVLDGSSKSANLGKDLDPKSYGDE